MGIRASFTFSESGKEQDSLSSHRPWKASRFLHTFPWWWRNRLFNLPGWIQDV